MGLLDDPVEELKRALAFDLEDEPEHGRIELFDAPSHNRTYVIGADFAYGIRGRDYDAAVVLETQTEPWVQVAEAQGWWGEEFHRVLFALAVHYNAAWVCGEAALGLLQLRTMLKKLEYGRLYYNRHEQKKGRAVTDLLGYWPRGNDLSIRKARLAVSERRVVVRSPALFDEIDRFAWIPKSEQRKRSMAHDELRDADLKPAASVGHDDLVRALCLAILMAEEAPLFEEIIPRYAWGTHGDVLGHSEVFGEDEDDEEEIDPFRRAR